jgi:hypothetical protein
LLAASNAATLAGNPFTNSTGAGADTGQGNKDAVSATNSHLNMDIRDESPARFLCSFVRVSLCDSEKTRIVLRKWDERTNCRDG